MCVCLSSVEQDSSIENLKPRIQAMAINQVADARIASSVILVQRLVARYHKKRPKFEEQKA